MDRHVFVPLLKPVVLLDVMEIITSDHYRPLHFVLDHHSTQDSTPNAHISGKRAFLIDIGAFGGLKRNEKEL